MKEDKYVNICFTIRSANTAGSANPPTLTIRFSVGCEEAAAELALICASTVWIGSTAIPRTAVTSELGAGLSMAAAEEIVEWD